MLSGKRVLLGVTGGIAAYKTTYLVRHLLKAGAEVQVIMTPAAREFVSPLSLATLSKREVLSEFFEVEDPQGKWNNHVALAEWADLMIIAPATSNSLSKMARAQVDNLLLGVYCSSHCPVFIAPAMDLDMYAHPGNKANLDILASYDHFIIPAESGELASGLEGQGRMAEPETILDSVNRELRKRSPLAGKKILINAGPTHEALDPVRYLGNRSSGKTGIALAEAAHQQGGQVTLVLGPTHLKPKASEINLIRVETALEMKEACEQHFHEAEWIILSAAISDYRPAQAAEQKIKKSGDKLQLELIPNPDILKGLGQKKQKGQVLVGYALETENALDNAAQKLSTKNCDLIVVNSPDAHERGFGHDTNEVILLDSNGAQTEISLKSKSAIAYEILDYLRDRTTNAE